LDSLEFNFLILWIGTGNLGNYRFLIFSVSCIFLLKNRRIVNTSANDGLQLKPNPMGHGKLVYKGTQVANSYEEN